jgi:hypothetical protein
LWYRPGLCQCRFRIGYRGPLIATLSPSKAGFTAGQRSLTAVPGRQHNCFPSALVPEYSKSFRASGQGGSGLSDPIYASSIPTKALSVLRLAGGSPQPRRAVLCGQAAVRAAAGAGWVGFRAESHRPGAAGAGGDRRRPVAVAAQRPGQMRGGASSVRSRQRKQADAGEPLRGRQRADVAAAGAAAVRASTPGRLLGGSGEGKG